MERERSLPGFQDQSLPDRYCDLVLTGGVTSAIAYPGVVYGLAQAYRFNAIGGSSSGAGSAALAAAAEYRRRRGSTEGFRTMLRRTAAVADDHGGRTGLAWLFQPDAWSRRLFRALLPAFAGPRTKGRTFCSGLWREYRGFALVGFAVGFAMTLTWPVLQGSAQWAAWVLAAVLVGLMVALSMVAGEIWQALRCAADSDYGLCSGQQQEAGAPHEPLTPWLHGLIQDIAGLPHDQPLTFADLWAAPGGPRETLGDTSPAGARSIDLRMFTANVSLGRPWLLPQRDDEPTLYFRPAEMRRLFPEAVVEFMQANSARYEAPAELLEPCRERQPAGRKPAGEADACLYALPRAQLPVLVAARMSVSFPVLFSAVPLWERVGAGRQFRRLLFADGGLCSNFPIHLFDSPIPAWPTFGVALHKDGGEAPQEPACSAAWVHVPGGHAVPPPDRWQGWDRESKPIERLLGFAGALLSTTMDWNDALLTELPGVRERIAHIALPAQIGGLNILMNARQIEWLGLAGGEAARQLLQRFSSPGSGGETAMAPGWLEHRWVRFNILAECLQESLVGLSRSAQHARHAEPIGEQIRRAMQVPPLQGDDGRTLRPAEAAALERTLEALLHIERALTPCALEQPYRPVPRPELRIRPPM